MDSTYIKRSVCYIKKLYSVLKKQFAKSKFVCIHFSSVTKNNDLLNSCFKELITAIYHTSVTCIVNELGLEWI